jgi:hypothetical protein
MSGPALPRTRMRVSHTTVVAYLALFIALGGSGYAATQIGGHAPRAVAQAARAPSVKVRCSASRSGRKVSCQVVKGSGVGPRGPRGLTGPRGIPGVSGAAGPTSFTQTSSFAYYAQTPGTTAVDVNTGVLHPAGESQYENFAVFTNPSQKVPANAPGEPIFRTYLTSPGELDGSPAHLKSVEFCYGSNPVAGTNTLAFTRARVVEYAEPPAAATGLAGNPPPFNNLTLADQSFSDVGVPGGSGGCQKITPATPATIDPSGYLTLEVTVTYTAPNSDTAGVQLTFGRVTTTYSP